MKKIFVFIGALILTASGVRSQDSGARAQDEQKLHFGLKAAPSLAWFTSDTKGFESSGTKLGFSYGLITEFNFSTL